MPLWRCAGSPPRERDLRSCSCAALRSASLPCAREPACARAVAGLPPPFPRLLPPVASCSARSSVGRTPATPCRCSWMLFVFGGRSRGCFHKCAPIHLRHPQRAQAIDRPESRNTVRNTLRARFQKLIHDLDPSAWYRVRLLFGPRRTDAQADQAQCFPVLCGDTCLRVWCGKHKGLSARRAALPCESGLLSVFYHSHSPQHVIQSLRFTITFFEYRTLSKRAANPSPGTK